MRKILLTFFLISILNSTSYAINIEKTYYDTGEIKCVFETENGIIHGEKNCYYKSGKLQSEVLFIKGKKNGIEKFYYENGMVEIEFTYTDGIQNGPCRLYYENGTLHKEAVLKNGEIDGIEKSYFLNGILAQEKLYQHGIVSGITKIYNNNGSLFATILYKDDTAVSGKCANGKKLSNKQLDDWDKGINIFCD